MLPDGLGSDAAIVELKYSNQSPGWMKSLIRELTPNRVSFSKYKAAMQQQVEVRTLPGRIAAPWITPPLQFEMPSL